jgi:hypothetical protein
LAVARPSSPTDLVTALQRLAKAAPSPTRDAVSAIADAVQIGDPESVLTEATAAPGRQPSPLTLDGIAVTTAIGQRCHLALNLRGAVPTGIAKRQVAPAAWSKVLCSKLSAWGHTVDDLGGKLVTEVNGPTTLAAVRSAVSDFVAAAVTETHQLISTLGAAGSAKAPRGLAFAVFVHDGLVQAALAFQAAQIAAQALPNDAHAFQIAGQALVQRLDSTGKQVEALVRDAKVRIGSRSVNQALARQPACAGVA